MTLWVVKGGPTGERDDRFLSHSIIGIGWAEVGDLSAYPDRETLKAGYRLAHLDRSDGHVNTQVGQLWRFGHRMRVGDAVVVPLRWIREIAVGEIVGDYRWTDSYGPDMPHVRDVRWIVPGAPRDAFDSDLLFSFGGSMSVCSVTRNDAERRVRAMVT